jgi:hypothetical protein
MAHDKGIFSSVRGFPQGFTLASGYTRRFFQNDRTLAVHERHSLPMMETIRRADEHHVLSACGVNKFFPRIDAPLRWYPVILSKGVPPFGVWIRHGGKTE